MIYGEVSLRAPETAASAAVYSGLMLAVRMTLAHFSVSSAMSLAKAPLVIGVGMPPISANRDTSLGSATAALISWLSLATISGGVPLGAPMPNHWLTSYPGTVSLTVGTSGKSSERAVLVTASARSLPERTYGSVDMVGSNIT